MSAVFYSAVLAIAVGWHVLAIAGIATATSGVAFYGMLAVIVVAFIVAVSMHPRSSMSGGEVTVGFGDVVRFLPIPLTVVGCVAVAYGIIATWVLIRGAQARLGVTGGISPRELGAPGISAFALSFAALAWLVGLSGVHARRSY